MSEITDVTIVAFALGVVLTLFVVGASLLGVRSCRARRGSSYAVAPLGDCGSGGTHKAWSAQPPHDHDDDGKATDAERGECSSKQARKAAAMSPQQFQESLRRLLSSGGDELPLLLTAPPEGGGLKHSELAELATQLELLERKVSNSLAASEGRASSKGKAPAIGLRAAALGGPEGLANISETRTPNSSDRSSGGDRSGAGSEECQLPGSLAPSPPPPTEPVPPPAQTAPDFGDPPSAPPREFLAGLKGMARAEPRPDLEFGPTDRQNGLLDPPEKCFPAIDMDQSMQHSLQTVQRILAKRDVQTTALQSQVREARQQLWRQTLEATSAKERLHDYLSDPSRAPQAQAEAIERLRDEARDLSKRLALSRSEEKHWWWIARRQRLYFIQSEQLGQEGRMLLRRHPAGEVFVAPQPITRPYEDEDQQDIGPGLNVGTSHCNPYQVDSWPFEQNVLAQRTARPPDLEDCEEGDEDLLEEDDDDDDESEPELGRHLRNPGGAPSDDSESEQDGYGDRSFQAGAPSDSAGAVVEEDEDDEDDDEEGVLRSAVEAQRQQQQGDASPRSL